MHSFTFSNFGQLFQNTNMWSRFASIGANLKDFTNEMIAPTEEDEEEKSSTTTTDEESSQASKPAGMKIFVFVK